MAAMGLLLVWRPSKYLEDDGASKGWHVHLLVHIAGADAVTLASWYVGDACTGLVPRRLWIVFFTNPKTVPPGTRKRDSSIQGLHLGH